MRPTLYVTNWSSTKMQGPGRCYTIMARPREWEHGEGRIPLLVPPTEWLDLVRAGAMSAAEYERRYIGRVKALSRLGPGYLKASVERRGVLVIVKDGDTLCCSCSRDQAALRRCHRVWVAEVLVRAGWRVILDGRDISLPPPAEQIDLWGES